MPAPRPGHRLIIGLRAMPARDNAYTSRNREILRRLGEVRDAPRAREMLKVFLTRLLRLRSPAIYDVLIVGWAENALTQWGGRLSWRGILEYRLYLWLCRRLSRAFIYVRHNEAPHNTPANERSRVQALIDQGESRADAVVAHSPVYAEQHDCAYVPHPLYDVAPGAGNREDAFIVFGRIERYKNIEVLIRAWTSSSALVVIGPCTDERYLDELRTLARDRPVTFDVGFKDEAEVARRISASNGVIIANAPESVIVSGTFFFALSCGARVFALETPFIRWVGSTGLAGAVRGFESIPALAAALEGVVEGPDAAAIRREAERLFGDDAVAGAWQAVLGMIVPALAGENDGGT